MGHLHAVEPLPGAGASIQQTDLELILCRLIGH